MRKLEQSRRALAEAFASALASKPRWEQAVEGSQPRRDHCLQQAVLPYVDYLCEYLRSGDATHFKTSRTPAIKPAFVLLNRPDERIFVIPFKLAVLPKQAR